MAIKVGLASKSKKRKQDADLLNNKKNIEKKFNSKSNGKENGNKRRKKNSNSNNNGNSYTVLYDNGNGNGKKRKNNNNEDFIPLNGGNNKESQKKTTKIDYRKKKRAVNERKLKRKEKEQLKKLEEFYDDLEGYYPLSVFEQLENDIKINQKKKNKDKKDGSKKSGKKDGKKDPIREKKREIDNTNFYENYDISKPVWAPYKRYTGTFEERLHEEILDFVKYITPNKSEIDTRLYTIDKLRSELHHRFPDSKLECFGSFSTGLFLPTSDLDVVVYRPGGDKNSASYAANPTQGNQSKNLNKIAKYIRGNGFFIHKVIRHSRIPIIKCEDDLTHYQIDISYNQESGVPAIKYIKQNIKKYPALKPLVYVLKHFLYINEMNEVFTGGLGSFSVVCLVLSFLKFYPKIFYESKDKECETPQNLGTLLINFLYLFGGGFDFENIGISVNDGSFYKKMDKGFYNFKQRYLLSLEDPIMPGNDLTKGSHRILEIAQAWKRALELLKKGEEKDINKVKTKQPSLLAKILYVDPQEINRRKQIREYIYPRVIKKSGNKYFTASPYDSDSEETENQTDTDNNKNDENIIINVTSNDTTNDTIDQETKPTIDIDGQANSKTEDSNDLDDLDDSQVPFEDIVSTMNTRKVNKKRKYDSISSDDHDDDDDDDDDDNNQNNDNDDNDSISDDDSFIEDDSNSYDNDDDEYIPVDSDDDDDNDNENSSGYGSLHDDDEIYIYDNGDEDKDKEESSHDEEYDEYIAKQEDDELDEEEFNSDIYNMLGEDFLDEDNINIDELLYK